MGHELPRDTLSVVRHLNVNIVPIAAEGNIDLTISRRVLDCVADQITNRLDQPFSVHEGSDILRIHTRKRSLQISDAEVMQLASLCDGFSGAEVEQAVVSAVYAAHAAGRTAGAPDILREIKATRPLSVVMAEKVEELREWAAERTVPAN